MEVSLPYGFEPRPYQVNILRALDQGCKRAVQVWHRRSGKEKTDVAAVMGRKMLERVGSYYYVFPELTQGRKILWDGMDRDGMRFIDHFPRSLMQGEPNNTEMKFRLINNSLFQVVGSDRFNTVLGTNPIGMVLSEYSLQDPMCWGYFRPILAENGGWAVFNFTPRGENHAHDLHQLALEDKFDPKTNPGGWFDEVLTVDDTKAVSQEILDRERKEIKRLYGNDALFLQEYYCSFTVPIFGAYYAEQISKAQRDKRIGNVPHDPALLVDTWWDLGVNDRTAIWFTQSVAQELRAIDYFEGSGQGLDYYAKALQDRGYVYGKHVAPHDITVRELTNGKSRRDTARTLGIDFAVAPKLPVIDGIDSVRAMFPRVWFDATRCKEGLNALKNYRKQYDDKRKTYLNVPYHDWSSNGADAFRTWAVARDYVKKDRRAWDEDHHDKYARAQARPRIKGVGVLG